MGGPKITIWVKYFISHHILLIFVLMCIYYLLKESISESFVKVEPSELNKMAILCQI